MKANQRVAIATPITEKEALAYRKKVKVRGPDECWPWSGAHNSRGYGTCQVDGHNVQAHRVAYRLTVGEIPAGLVLDHLCRNRWCQNPTHLEPVTCKENIRRGKLYRSHCSAGHELTEDNIQRTKDGYRVCLTCEEIRKNTPRKKRILSETCKRGHILPIVGVVRKNGTVARVCAECNKIREANRTTHKPCPTCGEKMARKSKTCISCRDKRLASEGVGKYRDKGTA